MCQLHSLRVVPSAAHAEASITLPVLIRHPLPAGVRPAAAVNLAPEAFHFNSRKFRGRALNRTARKGYGAG